MFTGIIESTAEVRTVQTVAGGKRLTLDVGSRVDGIVLGASVAVNGVCLTVASISGPQLSFDVIAETLRRTNLGQLRPGQKVNMERSLRVGDPLDGHFVQGHVDGTGTVRRIISGDAEHLIGIEPASELRTYITPKGSIAIDGVSLTIAERNELEFSVALIPTTLARTNLSSRRVGDTVNLETDMLVRAVVHYLQRSASPALDSTPKFSPEGWS